MTSAHLQSTMVMGSSTGTQAQSRPAHPLIVRAMHWIWAFAIICMILSDWQIYNASPILPFEFPEWMTLGGWLGGGIAWHLSAMWLLVRMGWPILFTELPPGIAAVISCPLVRGRWVT